MIIKDKVSEVNKGIFSDFHDAVINSGLIEIGFILTLYSAKRKLDITYSLGVIKKCHYNVNKNEINFHIKECMKKLEEKGKKNEK